MLRLYSVLSAIPQGMFYRRVYTESRVRLTTMRFRGFEGIGTNWSTTARATWLYDKKQYKIAFNEPICVNIYTMKINRAEVDFYGMKSGSWVKVIFGPNFIFTCKTHFMEWNFLAISMAPISSACDPDIWMISRARISSSFKPMKSRVVVSGRHRVQQLDYSTFLAPS